MKIDISRESLDTLSKEELIDFILLNKNLYDPIMYKVTEVSPFGMDLNDFIRAEAFDLNDLIGEITGIENPNGANFPLFSDLNTSRYPKDWMSCEIVLINGQITLTRAPVFSNEDYEKYSNYVSEYFTEEDFMSYDRYCKEFGIVSK